MKGTQFETIAGVRSSYSSLKKKFTTSVASIEAEIERLGIKIERQQLFIENLLRDIEVLEEKNAALKQENEELLYFSKIGREAYELSQQEEQINPIIRSQASTITILESIVFNLCEDSDDFQFISYAFLFPAIYEKIPLETEGSPFYLEYMPDTAGEVVRKGREFIVRIREICDTHLTNHEAWNNTIDIISDWWATEALPLLYRGRNIDWKTIKPFSIDEMEVWRDYMADRMMQFPGVYDSFETYNRYKDYVFESSGAKAFDLKFY